MSISAFPGKLREYRIVDERTTTTALNGIWARNPNHALEQAIDMGLDIMWYHATTVRKIEDEDATTLREDMPTTQ